jgi:hypothetical protein
VHTGDGLGKSAQSNVPNRSQAETLCRQTERAVSQGQGIKLFGEGSVRGVLDAVVGSRAHEISVRGSRGYQQQKY